MCEGQALHKMYQQLKCEHIHQWFLFSKIKLQVKFIQMFYLHLLSCSKDKLGNYEAGSSQKSSAKFDANLTLISGKLIKDNRQMNRHKNLIISNTTITHQQETAKTVLQYISSVLGT